MVAEPSATFATEAAAPREATLRCTATIASIQLNLRPLQGCTGPPWTGTGGQATSGTRSTRLRPAETSESEHYVAAPKRDSISDQLTTFHHAAT